MIEKYHLPLIVLPLFPSIFKSSGTSPKYGNTCVVPSSALTLSVLTVNVLVPLYLNVIVLPFSDKMSSLLKDGISLKSGYLYLPPLSFFEKYA